MSPVLLSYSVNIDRNDCKHNGSFFQKMFFLFEPTFAQTTPFSHPTSLYQSTHSVPRYSHNMHMHGLHLGSTNVHSNNLPPYASL